MDTKKTVNVAVDRDLHRVLKREGKARVGGIQRFVDLLLRAGLRKRRIDVEGGGK